MHLATLEMDAGPIIAQEVVPVLPGDSEATLHERIKIAERSLYPATVAWALRELEAGRSIEPPPGGVVPVGVGAPMATGATTATAGPDRAWGEHREGGADEVMTA